MVRKLDPLVDQLHLVPGKAEIVEGEIVHMSPASAWHGRAGGNVYRSLADHEERWAGGLAFPDNVGFLVMLPNRRSFSPDAAWLHGDPADLDFQFVDGPPAFAVEVRSESDYGPAAERRITDKIADYFAAGTLVVWDVDLLSDERIRCFRATHPVEPQIFRLNEVADAEPAVPGWKFPVNKLKR